MQKIKTGLSQDTGGTGRKFGSFRELTEFLKREEAGGGYEGAAMREESPGKGFNSFRELSEHLKREAARAAEPGHAVGAELPDDGFSHVSYHMHGFAPGDKKAAFAFMGNEGGNMNFANSAPTSSSFKSKGVGNPVAEMPCGDPDAKPEKKTANLTNKSSTPIPYKPEENSIVKYCKPNETCKIDAVYSPGGNKGKKKGLKVPRNCDVIVHPDGKLEVYGWLCKDLPLVRNIKKSTPQVIDHEFLGNNKDWPNPYTGYCWPEETWKD